MRVPVTGGRNPCEGEGFVNLSELLVCGMTGDGSADNCF